MSVTLAANDDGAIVEPTAPSNLITFLARAVHDPSVDVGKLEAIYRMQREIVADEARVQFHKAMNATQADTQAVVRDAINDQTRSKYATLEAVDAAIRPIYSRNGFSLSFTEVPNDAPEIKISGILRHAGGHSETYYLSALSDTIGPQGKPNKTNVQGVGSSVRYLQRYLTTLIFNIALKNEDNDGNRPKPANDTGEMLGQKAVELLYQLIADVAYDPAATATNERGFLDSFGFRGLTTIKDIPAREFARLKNALLDRKNQRAQRAALAANPRTQQGARS